MVIVQEKTVVFSNIQMQMICDIPVLFGKWNSHANFDNTSHLATNNTLLKYLLSAETKQNYPIYNRQTFAASILRPLYQVYEKIN